uniref:Protein kinase domain-containing protein n=1 Tax=Clastoptera arizonana TaxID=38151 RepID=A0A1B6DW38_9HEMI
MFCPFPSNRPTKTNFPAHQERNILYVEKEIEEARARGEADAYEIGYSRLTFGREIGKGAFGRVFIAEAEAIAGHQGVMTVAVKKLKNRVSADELEEFQAEISMMKRVGRHANIVTMLGCCTMKQPFCMIMEYVPCGDLLQYLRRLRQEYSSRRRTMQFTQETGTDSSYVTPNTPQTVTMSLSSGGPSFTSDWSVHKQPPVTNKLVPQLEYVLDPRELQSFAVQIARGMAYLESKQITHRDLAARNILIDTKKVLKISDFGLSRSGIYVNTKKKKVPLRWLSVEAMRDSLYSSKSDVWAFGIVLWEIGTLGGFPYPTVMDYDLLNFLLQGKRLEKPENFSPELYSLMIVCWSFSADDRPSFSDIVSYLDKKHRQQVYVDFRPDHQFPPTEEMLKITK